MDRQGNFIAGFVHGMGQAAKGSLDYLSHLAEEARERFADAAMKAKTSVSKAIHSQPSGALIKPCPKNMKAQRVEERKTALAGSKARLADMPPGKQREALAQATERFERNNVAVERARLAKDVYNVGQGEPPEGWERVSSAELKRLGMKKDLFPQLSKHFRASEFKDGYYPELYRSKPEILGEVKYVLCFRGTQGPKDGATDVIQAFGGRTVHYTRAIESAQKLRKVLGGNLEMAGHSMGGGMATAAGIVTGSRVFAIDPAGVHPATLERIGKGYARESAKLWVQNYVTEGEILDCVQNPHAQRLLLSGIAAISSTVGATLAIAGHRAMTEKGTVTYGAAGPIYRLPVLANAKVLLEDETMQGLTPGIVGKMNNHINPIQKIRLHDPDYAIAGIEQQKADDLTVITNSSTLEGVT